MIKAEKIQFEIKQGDEYLFIRLIDNGTLIETKLICSSLFLLKTRIKIAKNIMLYKHNTIKDINNN